MERRMRHSIGWIALTIAMVIAGGATQAADNKPLLREVQNTEEYFPDGIGSVWQYVGHTHTEKIERIAEVTFNNEVTTIGTSNMHGVMVKIFRETNQGNKGPTDGYFRRDASGITYYGSQPTTPFEQHLVPYRVLKFPLELHGSYQQLSKKNVDMQTDMDGDGHFERADVTANAQVVGYESITVGSGTFSDALRIDAVMTITVTLSKTRHLVVSTDTISSWFVRGIGLVKYVERVEAPPLLETRGEVTHLSEELDSYSLKGQAGLLSAPFPYPPSSY